MHLGTTLRSVEAAFAVALLVFGASAALAQDTRTVNVKFPRGSTGTTISDSIRGYQTVDYKIGVNAGQQMTVSLETSNASSYFNITAPGASEALFIGSINGTSTSFAIPSSGTYTISVYLMRNAARRDERAKYKLSVNVDNAVDGAITLPAVPAKPVKVPSVKPVSVDTDQMSRFCKGEAAAKYDVRPSQLYVNPGFKAGNRYAFQGYFDGDGGTTFFNCWFDLRGNFLSVS